MKSERGFKSHGSTCKLQSRHQKQEEAQEEEKEKEEGVGGEDVYFYMFMT